jgi:hypothetical protein
MLDKTAELVTNSPLSVSGHSARHAPRHRRFHIGIALAAMLLVFELLGRAFARWTPSKDPDDYRD